MQGKEGDLDEALRLLAEKERRKKAGAGAGGRGRYRSRRNS